MEHKTETEIGPFRDKVRRDNDRAFETLRETLDKKTFGDFITELEVYNITGFNLNQGLRARIRRYMVYRGHTVKSVPGDGYRVLTEREQAISEPTRVMDRNNRDAVKTLHVVSSTPRDKLSDAETRRADHMQQQLRRECETSTLHRQERKQAYRLTTRENRIPQIKKGDNR